MRTHDATNDLLPREDLAKQLFEHQVTGTISWSELSTANRAQWLAQAEQALDALASLGYHVEFSDDPLSARAEADRVAALAASAAEKAERLLGLGEPLLAYNAIQKALVDQPGDLRLRQLRGLALARSGALQRANETLAALRTEGHADGETLGLLARTHKDLALTVDDDEQREHHLSEAYEIYATGYRESEQHGEIADAYYTGINAATMAFLRDDLKTAREIAVNVEKLCRQTLRNSKQDADAYWPQATLAEAALILGDDEEARRHYASAARLVGSRYGNLSSTRHQARLLLEHAGEAADWLDEVMSIPPVLVYTGHMIDAPGRKQRRFAPDMEDQVRAGIRKRLEKLGPVAAYGSAACGADILCLESVRELGGELHIVLPFPVDAFRAMSVDLRPDGRWGERFEQLIDAADEVLVVSEQPPAGSTSAFEYANLIMTGLARLRAQLLDTHVQGLAVWDGTDTGDPGGTGTVVALWRDSGVPLKHVALPAAGSDAPGSSRGSQRGSETRMQDERDWPFEYTIESMLFADAVGYSRLTEAQVPLFFEHYMGTIAEYTDGTGHKAVHSEMAGDGMYIVFDSPDTAGHYALGLSELINSMDWKARGLPEDLGIRVGLHCGPVFVAVDPITRLPLYSGIHTSRTARIEPITPPGQVYASSAFAAVATARGFEGLRLSYIGRTQLAKHYGVLPLYHVKRDARRAVRNRNT